jgi:hypothetical protein
MLPVPAMGDNPALSKGRPFAGLRPFDRADAQFFFGREDHVYALYRLFDFSRFIAVVGSSGSGKSSLVRAGLLPLLEQSPQGWRTVTLRPGDRPLRSLAAALEQLAEETNALGETPPAVLRQRIEFHVGRSGEGIVRALDEMRTLGNEPLLLLVDQFEELFRYGMLRATTVNEKIRKGALEEEAAAFVRRLLDASRSRGRRIHVMITMRSDFIGDCARFYELPEAVSASQYLTPSLTRDQRDEVIRKPLGPSNSTIESGLVERMLRDAGYDPDQLPVLQHCLLRLWRAAPPDASGSRNLTEAKYDAIGQLENALSRHADEVMHEVDEVGADDAVERLFRALSDRDRDGRAIRRPRSFKDLVAETGVEPKRLETIIDAFRDDDCAFLTPSKAAEPQLRHDTYVDVAHEALLRKWDKLSAENGWLDREEADGRTYRALLAILRF